MLWPLRPKTRLTRRRLQRNKQGLLQGYIFLLTKAIYLSQVYFEVGSDRNPNHGNLREKETIHVDGQFMRELQGLQELEGCHWMSPHPLLVLSLCWLHSLTVQISIVDIAADPNITSCKLSDPRQKENIQSHRRTDRLSLYHMPIPEPIIWPEIGTMIVRSGHMQNHDSQDPTKKQKPLRTEGIYWLYTSDKRGSEVSLRTVQQLRCYQQ